MGVTFIMESPWEPRSPCVVCPGGGGAYSVAGRFALDSVTGVTSHPPCPSPWLPTGAHATEATERAASSPGELGSSPPLPSLLSPRQGGLTLESVTVTAGGERGLAGSEICFRPPTHSASPSPGPRGQRRAGWTPRSGSGPVVALLVAATVGRLDTCAIASPWNHTWCFSGEPLGPLLSKK